MHALKCASIACSDCALTVAMHREPEDLSYNLSVGKMA